MSDDELCEDLEEAETFDDPDEHHQPSARMQALVQEMTALLNKYDVGAAVCLADRQESVLLQRVPNWSAVTWSNGGLHFNSETMAQAEDLENLLYETFCVAETLKTMSSRCASGMDELGEYLKTYTAHYLSHQTKPH